VELRAEQTCQENNDASFECRQAEACQENNDASFECRQAGIAELTPGLARKEKSDALCRPARVAIPTSLRTLKKNRRIVCGVADEIGD
jgi:hypothetical protein